MPAATTLPTVMILVMCLFSAIGVVSVVYWAAVASANISYRFSRREDRENTRQITGSLYLDSGELLGQVEGRIFPEHQSDAR